MSWVDSLVLKDHATKMAMLAVYIDHHKIAISALNTPLEDYDWALLGAHLHYVNLNGIHDISKVEWVLTQCPKATEVFIDHPKIVDLPDFPKCKTLICAGCKELRKLPDLPHCITLDCHDCYRLTQLPDLPVCTSLNCKSCERLTQLPNLPVCTSLNCKSCERLTQLPNLPVCTILNCSDTNLTRIPDLPVCTTIECYYCRKLTQLPDLPVCTTIECYDCYNLTQLPDLPVCTTIECYYCKSLTQLPDLPVCTSLDCSSCYNLTRLPDLPVCTSLNCKSCERLTQLPNLPVCTILNCSDTNLTRLPDLPVCRKLRCNNCYNLTQLPHLPVCTILDCAFCGNLTQLPHLPVCTILDCAFCGNLTQLPDLPVCTSLDCSRCYNLTQLPDLLVCTALDCSRCENLTQVGNLPLCRELNCEDCPRLPLLPPLPQCQRLRCGGCTSLQELPEMPPNAQVFSTNTRAGEFTQFIVNQEEFATNPSKILLELGNFLLNDGHFPNVYYYLNGKPSEAIDVGGVRRDLISSLSENLFKGKGEGFLAMEEGLPLFQQGQEKCYHTLGRVLALCYPAHSDFKVGALFSKKTYELLASLLMQDNDQKEEEWLLTQHASLVGLPVEEVKGLINLSFKAVQLGSQEKMYLNYFLDPEGAANYDFSLPEVRSALRNKLAEEAAQDKRLTALILIGGELKKGLGLALDNGLTGKLLMDKIQGVLDANALIQKLDYHQTENVPDAKFAQTKAYLTDWIKRADMDTLRRFVRAVTGNNSLSEQHLKIEVYNRVSGFIPIAHTCFFSLELTGNCPNQIEFDEKLEILLTEGMAGTGFQFA